MQNHTAYKIDLSRMQGFVIIPNDAKTVVLRQIPLQREHSNQDKTTAWSLSDAKAPIDPNEMVLRAKLK